LTVALAGTRGRALAVRCMVWLAAAVVDVTGETLFEVITAGSDDGCSKSKSGVCVEFGVETLLCKEGD